MLGRSWKCLFAVGMVFASANILRGQSDFSRRASSLPESTAGSSGVTSAGPLFQPHFPIAPVIPHPTVPPVFGLPQMTRAAGIIFSGHVISVARESASGAASLETVAIAFHIDRGIRGAATGKSVTIHEWRGAWSSGQRYRMGERVFLFLYPPSKLGLTSCVAGPIGRFAVDHFGRVQFSGQHLAAFASDPALAGKSRVTLDEFAGNIQRFGGEERVQP